MTKTIEINIPKPGDSLPFEVLRWEWEGCDWELHYEYSEGFAQLQGEHISYAAMEALASLLNIPMQLPCNPATVAEVTE